MKKIIRLNEQHLTKVVNECITRIINEGYGDTIRFIPGLSKVKECMQLWALAQKNGGKYEFNGKVYSEDSYKATLYQLYEKWGIEAVKHGIQQEIAYQNSEYEKALDKQGSTSKSQYWFNPEAVESVAYSIYSSFFYNNGKNALNDKDNTHNDFNQIRNELSSIALSGTVRNGKNDVVQALNYLSKTLRLFAISQIRGTDTMNQFLSKDVKSIDAFDHDVEVNNGGDTIYSPGENNVELSNIDNDIALSNEQPEIDGEVNNPLEKIKKLFYYFANENEIQFMAGTRNNTPFIKKVSEYIYKHFDDIFNHSTIKMLFNKASQPELNSQGDVVRKNGAISNQMSDAQMGKFVKTFVNRYIQQHVPNVSYDTMKKYYWSTVSRYTNEVWNKNRNRNLVAESQMNQIINNVLKQYIR